MVLVLYVPALKTDDDREVYCKSLLTYEQLVEAVVLLHLPLAEDDDRERVADEAHQAQAADQIAAHNLVKPEKHTIQSIIAT